MGCALDVTTGDENRILVGDAIERLRDLPDGLADCCVTSPPYWGLRDYGAEGQIGLEPTPEKYVARLIDVFREARRTLRDDGTLWLVVGDSYAHGGCGARDSERWPKQARNDHMPPHAKKRRNTTSTCKPKDLVGIPWMLAFALRADGWWLREEVIWAKPNPMPESVRDRCTRSHETVFHLCKSARYYHDHEAIKEKAVAGHDAGNVTYARPARVTFRNSDGSPRGSPPKHYETRNKRDVWTVTTKPFKGAHFAAYPPDLIEPCVLASSRPGGIVLDPFFGAGTTGLVAQAHGRGFVGIEINPEYARLADARLRAAALEA